MPRTIQSETLEANATRQLQAEKPRDWRARYHQSDLSGAVRAAARYAQKAGADAFVIAGNRWGCFCWHVSHKQRDVTCLVTNSGGRAYRITPAAQVYKLDVA